MTNTKLQTVQEYSSRYSTRLSKTKHKNITDKIYNGVHNHKFLQNYTIADKCAGKNYLFWRSLMPGRMKKANLIFGHHLII